MHSSKRKYAATEGKRKTRTPDKACTSIKKSVDKRSQFQLKMMVHNLQAHASHSVPVPYFSHSESP